MPPINVAPWVQGVAQPWNQGQPQTWGQNNGPLQLWCQWANIGVTNGVDDLVMLLGLQNQIIGAQILDSGGVGHLFGIHGCHKGVNMIKGTKDTKVEVFFKDYFFSNQHMATNYGFKLKQQAFKF
jgi:hypothetical protein